MPVADPTLLSGIHVVFMDVDGVLTDGGLYMHDKNTFFVRFHVRDGYGIKQLLVHGIHVVWITGRGGKAVQARAAELGITDLYEKADDKVRIAERWLAQHGYAWTQAAYIGDDMPDLQAIKAAKLGIAVADASLALRDVADWVLDRPGGYGAVRQVCDALLQAR